MKEAASGAGYVSPFEGLLETLSEDGLDEAALSPDERYLLLAAREADKGVGRTLPNPPVGAVVVKDGEIVGRGFHAYAGARHGEVVALDEAGSRAEGATLYVTLEPCNHQGRTGPCTERVLADEVARVVVGARDPNPRVPGGGNERLRTEGVEVSLAEGYLARRAQALIAPFSRVMHERRPWVVAKVAASLDGRIATGTKDARWITGEASRALVHSLRDRVDAILVGSGTVLADDPALTARSESPRREDARNPLRVVLDGALQTDPGQRVYQRDARDVPGRSHALVAHLAGAPAERTKAFDDAGVERIEVPAKNGHADVEALLRALAARGVLSVLVEPGEGLLGALIAGGLVDELWWFAAPLLVGGDGVAAVPGLGVERLADAVRLASGARVRRVGDDVLLVGTMSPAP